MKWAPQRLIEIICAYSKRHRRILEVGCLISAESEGSDCWTERSKSTIYLGSLGYAASGIDSDPHMIKLARSIARKTKHVSFAIDDMRTLTREIHATVCVFTCQDAAVPTCGLTDKWIRGRIAVHPCRSI